MIDYNIICITSCKTTNKIEVFTENKIFRKDIEILKNVNKDYVLKWIYKKLYLLLDINGNPKKPEIEDIFKIGYYGNDPHKLPSVVSFFNCCYNFYNEIIKKLDECKWLENIKCIDFDFPKECIKFSCEDNKDEEDVEIHLKICKNNK